MFQKIALLVPLPMATNNRRTTVGQRLLPALLLSSGFIAGAVGGILMSIATQTLATTPQRELPVDAELMESVRAAADLISESMNVRVNSSAPAHTDYIPISLSAAVE